MSRALPGLESAALVPTTPFSMAQQVLARTHRLHDIAVLSGPAGCGKTYAVEHWLTATGQPHVYLEMPPRPAAKEVTVRLLTALVGGCNLNAPDYVLTDELDTALKGSGRIVVIDEAHNLGTSGLQKLRYWHQRGEFSWTLILVGSQVAEVFFTAPEMRTRAEGLVTFQPLAGADLLLALKRWHPLLAASSNDDLRFIDDQWAHGNFRHWAKFLRTSLGLADTLGVSTLTDTLISATLAAIGAHDWQRAAANRPTKARRKRASA